MKICPKCQVVHYKPGKFCSRSCANSRIWDDHAKQKRGNILREYIANNPSWRENQSSKLAQRSASLKETLFDKHLMRFNAGAIKDRGALKAWLIATKTETCNVCKLLPVWNGKPLSLQVDHMNGNPKDNRPENLRLLCPNCHSQTETFAGKTRTPES